MGTYVFEGVELKYKVKMVFGDRQQPLRSQKLPVGLTKGCEPRARKFAITGWSSGEGVFGLITFIYHLPCLIGVRRTITQYGL